MAIQELNLEKVLELVPSFKSFGFTSFTLVDGELNTVSDSQFPFELMELAESKILKAVKDGYFCDAKVDEREGDYDCSSVSDDCESCDLMKVDDVDDELNTKEILDLAESMNVSPADVLMFAQSIANSIQKDKAEKALEAMPVETVQAYAIDANKKFQSFQTAYMTNQQARQNFQQSVLAI